MRDARRIDEEKEADDDDGYKGGCPSSFSSAAANPSGDRAAAVCGLPLKKKTWLRRAGRNLTRMSDLVREPAAESARHGIFPR